MALDPNPSSPPVPAEREAQTAAFNRWHDEQNSWPPAFTAGWEAALVWAAPEALLDLIERLFVAGYPQPLGELESARLAEDTERALQRYGRKLPPPADSVIPDRGSGSCRRLRSVFVKALSSDRVSER